jgi:anti-sigma factor ChrR (cupin superfamily)
MGADLTTVRVDEVAGIEVGPGCRRRDLPAGDGVRVWVVDMAPGSSWPHVDVHDQAGEEVFVVSGELIEGERRFGPGTYLLFGPDSRHQPRTETGVRLFGFNLAAGARR